MTGSPAEELRRAAKRIREDASWPSEEFALAVAALLEDRAAEYDGVASGPYGPAGASFLAGDAGGDADLAIAIARAYLGSEAR